jgi:hypothetical protein
MNVLLMDADADFHLEGDLPAYTDDLMQDLELDLLLRAMAGQDAFLYEIARCGVLRSVTDPAEIEYRQQVLADCLAWPGVVRTMYGLAVEAINGEARLRSRLWYGWPDAILQRSVQVIAFFVPLLKQLRSVADAQADGFQSPGFLRLFAALQGELSDEYLQIVEDHLQELKFRGGIVMSVSLGEGNKGVEYALRRVPERSLVGRLLGDRDGYSFQIDARDEAGETALSELRDRGENSTANALARSVDHILSFFTALRTELGFYIGCMNLLDTLTARGYPTCTPLPGPRDTDELAAEGLYDVTLALTLEGEVVGNDLAADGKRLVMITGANQGGKSTYLRSLGLAYLMMQCGMAVPATSFRAGVCTGIFTHYKREEDATMVSGKLDEELRRMSAIADAITPGSLLLCNESFAATNEREGSEIARQVIRALIETDVRVVYVTHLYDLAHGFFQQAREDVLFLRAARGEQGRRPFKLTEGEPEPTSHGEDTYRQVFGMDASRGGAGYDPAERA